MNIKNKCRQYQEGDKFNDNENERIDETINEINENVETKETRT